MRNKPEFIYYNSQDFQIKQISLSASNVIFDIKQENQY